MPIPTRGHLVPMHSRRMHSTTRGHLVPMHSRRTKDLMPMQDVPTRGHLVPMHSMHVPNHLGPLDVPMPIQDEPTMGHLPIHCPCPCIQVPMSRRTNQPGDVPTTWCPCIQDVATRKPGATWCPYACIQDEPTRGHLVTMHSRRTNQGTLGDHAFKTYQPGTTWCPCIQDVATQPATRGHLVPMHSRRTNHLVGQGTLGAHAFKT